MIALDLYVGENSLANHLSSPKRLCSRRRDPTGTRHHVLRSLRAPAVTHGGTLIDRLWV